MIDKIEDRDAWFAPKRYGYGAGLPITWQGWAVLAAYVAALAGIGLLDRSAHAGARAAAFALFLLVTGLLVVVLARRTRGGLKWRWGKRD
jgi:membrane-associated PAP2 superfamily phosphatase